MAGDKPWPEVPIGNKDHANAAVVIIGAGISGKFKDTQQSPEIHSIDLNDYQECAQPLI